MNILIFGDTHMPSKAFTLPQILREAMGEADEIIHTGDWQTYSVYNELQAEWNIVGVHGNADESEVQNHLPASLTIERNGYRIGVVHGHEGRGGITEKRAENAFKEKADIVLFGHSHIPYLRFHGKMLLINPGSATDKRKAPLCSFAWLNLSEHGLHARHIFY
ncbi:MAG: metallophosphoesterase [Alkalicoccus sp.]|nr:MAG: metallophosphoesterase [Alkalicoccus sp.]